AAHVDHDERGELAAARGRASRGEGPVPVAHPGDERRDRDRQDLGREGLVPEDLARAEAQQVEQPEVDDVGDRADGPELRELAHPREHALAARRGCRGGLRPPVQVARHPARLPGVPWPHPGGRRDAVVRRAGGARASGGQALGWVHVAAPVIAVVGGGQLARMMAPAAGELGVHLRVLVEAPDSSAAQVVVDAPVGVASDEAAIRSLIAPAGATPADVLTFEHEHVPNALLTDLLEHGTPVRPGPDALVHAQDKIVMRRRLTELGVPCPRCAALPTDPTDARTALAGFLAEVGGEAVVKTARGGYDGKGVRVVSLAAGGPEQVAEWIEAAAAGGPELLVEEKVPFTRELAVRVARRPSGGAEGGGEERTWPVVGSIQRDGVCAGGVAPAPGLTDAEAERARDAAVRIAEGLGVTGVLAVEMFEVAGEDGPRVLVNELAMRPHNSGHWTIDGAVTSQFEQHLRAVLDLPLGDTAPTARWTVMANVLGSTLDELTDALPAVLAAYPDAKVNLYGKGVRPGRKLGHVNVSGDDLDEVRRRALAAAAVLRGEDPEGTPNEERA